MIAGADAVEGVLDLLVAVAPGIDDPMAVQVDAYTVIRLGLEGEGPGIKVVGCSETG